MDFNRIKREKLSLEFKQVAEKKTMLLYEIALHRDLDPEEIVAKKPLKTTQSGQVLSTEDIKRKDYLKMCENDVENLNQRIKAIEEVYDKEE